MLELDAGQASPQTFSPPLFIWEYGLTFEQPHGQPCPDYAFAPYIQG